MSILKFSLVFIVGVIFGITGDYLYYSFHVRFGILSYSSKIKQKVIEMDAENKLKRDNELYKLKRLLTKKLEME